MSTSERDSRRSSSGNEAPDSTTTPIIKPSGAKVDSRTRSYLERLQEAMRRMSDETERKRVAKKLF